MGRNFWDLLSEWGAGIFIFAMFALEAARKIWGCN